MSYRLKGFVELTSETMSSSNEIAPYGELSTLSLTYAKNKRLYVKSTNPAGRLVAFLTKDSTGVIDVPETIRTKLFQVTDWIVSNQNGSNKATTKASFLTKLTQQFSSSITSIACGDLVTKGTGANTVHFPGWISFSQTGITSTASYSTNEIKIWYSDSKFKSEYDEHEIVIIPPLTDINGLFGNKATVEAALDLYKDNNLIPNIQTARAQCPETKIVSERYLWKDSTTVTQEELNISWVALIYGRLNSDEDSIKLAIKAYIASKSNRSVANWTALLPDIYRTTEFFFLPRWRNYAIPDRELQAGQFSTIARVKKELDYAKTALSTIAGSHIDANLSIMPFQYKSICALVVGGVSNRNNLFSIEQVMSDYLNVPSTDVSFDLQSPNTKSWINSMIIALRAAETIGANDSPPQGMRLVTNNSVLYVSFKLDNINYLVATKATTPNYAGD